MQRHSGYNHSMLAYRQRGNIGDLHDTNESVTLSGVVIACYMATQKYNHRATMHHLEGMACHRRRIIPTHSMAPLPTMRPIEQPWQWHAHQLVGFHPRMSCAILPTSPPNTASAANDRIWSFRHTAQWVIRLNRTNLATCTTNNPTLIMANIQLTTCT